ncbi:MAG: ATP-binding cassette domain-containing protein [Rhizobiales bacterium]|nr:ATP-binding cassette domain-containing protein [Hyphomicrobiales bacterium]
MGTEPAIRVRDLVVGFGREPVLRGLSLDVARGQVLGLVGGSGSGKSVLLRTIIGLIKPQQGVVEVLGVDVDRMDPGAQRELRRKWGVLFQRGALFSSLSVQENLEFAMRERVEISPRLRSELAIARLEMVGLAADDATKMPSELSGGMVKRVALARALALDPDLVFLDEPTSGLDPLSAARFDELILALHQTLGFTVFMVTHDLDSLNTVCDRIAALADGRVVAIGGMADMQASEHPWVRDYFSGPRARRAFMHPGEPAETA